MKQENTKWQHITRTWPRGITPTQRITQQKQQSLTLNTTGRPAQRTLSLLGRVSSPTRLTFLTPSFRKFAFFVGTGEYLAWRLVAAVIRD